MKYKLGKKYVGPKPNVLNVVIASLFATAQVTILLTLTLLGTLLVSLVLKDYWYLNLIILLLAVLWIPFIYRKCMYRAKVLDVEMYRVFNAILFAFVCIPISFTVLSYIVTNMDEGVNIDKYHFRGVAATAKQSFAFILNDYAIVIGKIKITFPKIMTLIVSALTFLYLEYRILTLKSQDMIYIKSEKAMAFPKYQFTLVDSMNKVEVISYEYLRRLEVDVSSKVVANKLYYDVYTYGEGDEQYFFIEYYLTKNKDGKVVESKRRTTPIYCYDITNFDEQNIQNTTKIHAQENLVDVIDNTVENDEPTKEMVVDANLAAAAVDEKTTINLLKPDVEEEVTEEVKDEVEATQVISKIEPEVTVEEETPSQRDEVEAFEQAEDNINEDSASEAFEQVEDNHSEDSANEVTEQEAVTTESVEDEVAQEEVITKSTEVETKQEDLSTDEDQLDEDDEDDDIDYYDEEYPDDSDDEPKKPSNKFAI